MATMNLTKAEQKQMRDTHECPCCGKPMTATQVNNLMNNSARDDDGEVSESYRGFRGFPGAIELPDGNILNLREAGSHVDAYEATSLARAAEAQYAESWAGLLGGNAPAVKRALRGRDTGGRMSDGAIREFALRG